MIFFDGYVVEPSIYPSVYPFPSDTLALALYEMLDASVFVYLAFTFAMFSSAVFTFE